MLDSRLYLPGRTTTFPNIAGVTVETVFRTFAVLNIDVKDGAVTLPEWCMSILIYTPDRPGTVGPSSRIVLLPSHRPNSFQLYATRPTRTIPIHESESYGMQLVTHLNRFPK